jgi:hypothetical protein
MLLLRVVFLELLVCFHVIGAAVLFRRLFPRENPWLGFLLPTLILLSGLNFIEHFIAVPNLGWVLPVTLAGLLWAMLKPGYSWEGLRLPSILFVVTFTFVLLLKSLSPDIPNYTEGTGNMTRVLNYCLGGTLPPIDCWLPPYDYGGYYSFQQYGAAIMKRLFFLDLGTAYNLGFAFLLAWTCLVGAAVAHAISGKAWIAWATVMVLLAGSTGSVLFFLFSGHAADYGLSTCLNDAWDDPSRNPFAWLCAQDKYHPGLKLLPPTYTLYYSEFHANLGGTLVTMASLLASVLVFKIERSNWPWISLAVLPMLVIITSAWFFFIVLFFCAGSLALALIGGRRPQDWRFAVIGGAIGLTLIWPSFFSVSGNPATQDFLWTLPGDHTPFWMFAVQWWPVYLPWLFLCFIWNRLGLMARWFHAAIPLLLIAVEFATFGDRGLTVEKMWGALYGAGLVTFLPLVFMQTGLFFRGLSAFILLVMVICLGTWLKTIYYDPVDRHNFFRLQGDNFVQNDSQQKRLLQVLSSLHGATILPGKSYWAYNEAPAVIGFSENRCYIAYFHQEDQSGHGGEAEYRSDLNNAFYAGTMTTPLPFLRTNDIAAVLIWPDDKISDQLLQQFQNEIGSDYYYINCKLDGANNAGVFMRLGASTAAASTLAPITPAPLDLSPTPAP